MEKNVPTKVEDGEYCIQLAIIIQNPNSPRMGLHSRSLSQIWAQFVLRDWLTQVPQAHGAKLYVYTYAPKLGWDGGST